MINLNNSTITDVCRGLVGKNEAWDVMTTVAKSQGVMMIVSFIIIPILLFIVLNALIGVSGTIKRSKLVVMSSIIMVLCEIIGIAIYIMLNVYNIPFING